MSKQHYEEKTIREASILTNSYVSSDIRGNDDNVRVTERNQCLLYIDLTIWSLTSAEIKIEFSSDDVTYYQECTQFISSGIATIDLKEYTFDSDWKYRLAIPIKDRYIKVSAKWTWTVSGSSLAISIITWVN